MSSNANSKCGRSSVCAREIRSRPHIVDLEAPRCAQPRHIGERKLLCRARGGCIDDEHMDSLARLSGVVFGRRCSGHGGVCGDWQSGGSDGGILVERKKFGIFDDSQLVRIQQAQL